MTLVEHWKKLLFGIGWLILATGQVLSQTESEPSGEERLE